MSNELYSNDGDSVELLGIRCPACGYVAFPRHHYGCEKCGAPELVDVALPARGTLTSFATVHLHQSKSIAAPFVIGEIKLDSGPTVRLTLLEPTDAQLSIGARMTGVILESELRFRRDAA